MDSTPGDTDVGIIEGEGSIDELISNSVSNGYGQWFIIIKNDEDAFTITRDENGETQNEYVNYQKYELFKTAAGREWGIRTGFPVPPAGRKAKTIIVVNTRILSEKSCFRAS